MTRVSHHPSAAAAGLLLVLTAPAVSAQGLGGSLDGLEWTFVRIRYSSEAERLEQFRRRYWSEPWAIDGPAAEQNLSRRMARVTSVKVNDPLIMELSDRRLWEYPWIYFVEPANMELSEEEAGILREFLLRGGTATFDDFHGPLEWELFEQQLRRVFPDRGAGRAAARPSGIQLLLRAAGVSADSRTRLVLRRRNLGEGRLPGAAARHPG